MWVKSPEMSPHSASWVLPGNTNAMKKCARFNKRLTTQPGEVTVRFNIAIMSLWPHARPCSWWESQSSPLKCYLDPAAWVLPPGKINAIITALIETGDLPYCRVKSTCDSSCFSVSLIACKAVFVVEKRVDWPEMSPRSAWVLPGKINAMENCAHCNRGLITLMSEVNVRFIVLLVLFDRTQVRVRGGKAGRLTWNVTSFRRRGCFQPSRPSNRNQDNVVQILWWKCILLSSLNFGIWSQNYIRAHLQLQ